MKLSVDKVVTIHQPNFFPWLGYFNKIARADLFLVMDNVQFQKTGGTWSNRVQLMIGGKAGWLTMPVVRNYHGVRTIGEMLINNTINWRPKALKTLQMNYSRAPFFATVFPWLEELVNNPTDNLVDYNLSAIRVLMAAFKLDCTRVILGSSLSVMGSATDLLVSMTKAAGGTVYLSGDGSRGYQADEKFVFAGIKLEYQNFQHPVYPQYHSTQFVPGLSVIDALMNCGVEQTAILISEQQSPGSERNCAN